MVTQLGFIRLKFDCSSFFRRRELVLTRHGRMSGAGSGFAGSIGGKFFGQSPLWIDVAKPPGFSKQVAVTWSAWAKNFALGAHIVKSPNLIWLAITVLVYGVFPYDIEAAKA